MAELNVHLEDGGKAGILQVNLYGASAIGLEEQYLGLVVEGALDFGPRHGVLEHDHLLSGISVESLDGGNRGIFQALEHGIPEGEGHPHGTIVRGAINWNIGQGEFVKGSEAQFWHTLGEDPDIVIEAVNQTGFVAKVTLFYQISC